VCMCVLIRDLPSSVAFVGFYRCYGINNYRRETQEIASKHPFQRLPEKLHYNAVSPNRHTFVCIIMQFPKTGKTGLGRRRALYVPMHLVGKLFLAVCF
jgi:hypothetical protein